MMIHCRKIALLLKKSPSWCLRGRQEQGYEQTRVSDAAGNLHCRRLAAYDGATRPFGVAVLLLPHRRSPQNHLLRFIDRYVSFDFVREKLRASYSETGRPSMDPEVLLRILLLGYLYGITSEQKLLEELRMHLAWRWFTGLGFEQEIPHHSTFSKNRHGRFQESNLFQELFERIVEQCIAAGLVEGEQMSVDGSFIMANASHHSRIPREQFTEAAQVNYGARKYLEELEQENGDGEPIHQQDKVSTTDPDSTYLTKGNRAAELGYFDNYLIDNESCVIVGVQATAARLSQESAGHETGSIATTNDTAGDRWGWRPITPTATVNCCNGSMIVGLRLTFA